jgi:hypothetical protein
MGQWRATAASAIGTSHVKRQEPCQDVSLCAVSGERLICAVSDGAGSAAHAEIGAQLAAIQFAAWARTITDPGTIDRDQVTHFLDSLRTVLAAEAQATGAVIADYACTLLGVVATPHCMVCCQIGDGAIVASGAEVGTYEVTFWPQHGEYANTTNFVTQANAAAVCEVRVWPPVTAFALFSDGLERLILNEAARTVHAPALAPVFDWFRSPEAADAATRSHAVTSWLDSDRINARTDDDKSLVVAVLTED